jgi:hypothetical protein
MLTHKAKSTHGGRRVYEIGAKLRTCKHPGDPETQSSLAVERLLDVSCLHQDSVQQNTTHIHLRTICETVT